jgi:hypothetical protein
LEQPLVPAIYDLIILINIDREKKHDEHEPRSSHAEEAETNPSSSVVNHSAVPQNLVNAVDRVIFYGTRRHELSWGFGVTSIEVSGGSIREIAFRN